MFIDLFVSIVGLAFIFRTFVFYEKNYPEYFLKFKKILFCIFLLIFCINIYFAVNNLNPLIFFVVAIFLTVIIFEIYKKWRIQKSFERIPHLLDLMILKIQQGNSARTSIQKTFNECTSEHSFLSSILKDPAPQKLYTKNFALLQFSTFNDDLQSLLNCSYNVLDRTKALKRKYSLLIRFKKRSQQIYFQVGIQSLVLMVMYLCVLIFASTQFDISKWIGTLILSLLIYFLGIFLSFYLGKKRKWRV